MTWKTAGLKSGQARSKASRVSWSSGSRWSRGTRSRRAIGNPPLTLCYYSLGVNIKGDGKYFLGCRDLSADGAFMQVPWTCDSQCGLTDGKEKKGTLSMEYRTVA